jgi:hypothetical protein
MWATNNSHESLVKVLLEHGANAQTKSAKGRTVFDFINNENQKMVDILVPNSTRDSISSSTSSLFYNKTSVSSSSTSDENDYCLSNNDHLEEAVELRKKLFESTMALALEQHESDDDDDEDYNNELVQEDEDQEEQDEDEEEDENTFDWNKCSPHQMFVFNSNDLNYILDTVITNIQLPLSSQQDICVPSNVIFLSARFAHYFSSHELLNHVLEGALNRISLTIKVIQHYYYYYCLSYIY